MGTREKLIKRVESRPVRHDITLSELSAYLSCFGFHQVRQRGSHRQFLHPKSGHLLTIAEHDGNIAAAYVKEAVRMAQCVKEEEHELSDLFVSD